MSSHFLSLSRRIRKTHFTDRVIENGVKGFTVYNHMLLPTYFKSIEEDYHHLKNEVQVWDVSCERQVQIKGKDAFKLLEMITPRNLNKLSEKKCLYFSLPYNVVALGSARYEYSDTSLGRPSNLLRMKKTLGEKT